MHVVTRSHLAPQFVRKRLVQPIVVSQLRGFKIIKNDALIGEENLDNKLEKIVGGDQAQTDHYLSKK